LASAALLIYTVSIWKTGRITQMLVLIVIANVSYILNQYFYYRLQFDYIQFADERLLPPFTPTDATINAVLLHQRLWISFYCIYLFTIFFVFWTFSLTYFITSIRFECMIKSTEFDQTRLNIIFVVVSIV